MTSIRTEVEIEYLSQRERDVLSLVRSEASKEPNWESGRIFNSLSCRPHPLALRAFLEFADMNLLKEQSTAGVRMEAEVVQEYSSWFGASGQLGRNGYVCSGGTEANFVALWAAKAKHPQRQKIVVSRYGHYSHKRFAFPLGLTITFAPLHDEELEVDTSCYLNEIDDNTLAVVVTAGDPILGRVDPMKEILEAARQHKCAVHIDASYGGYFLPFIEQYETLYGSALGDAGATSLSLDPHKYGLCPLGTGLLLFSDKEDLDRIALSVPFPPIESRTFQGSRSAGPTAAAWAMLKFFGRTGYSRMAHAVTSKRVFMERRLGRIKDLRFVIPPRLTSIGFRIDGVSTRTQRL